MELTKIRELIKSLITESATDEQLQTFGQINGELENLEKQENDLVEKHEELRKKYIDVIKDTSFKEKLKEDDKPITLEEAIQEQLENR